VPALVSVTDMDPDVARVPDHPSPASPPEGVQESVFFELQTNEMLWPSVWVATLAEKLTVGAGAFAEAAGTAV
jgi:hypothetical protein